MEFKLRCTRAFIAGGNGGIGLAIAKKLIENNVKVCIGGRNQNSLEEIKKDMGENVSVLQFDISDIGSHVGKLNDAACLLGGYYDCVINAAGVHSSKGNWTMTEDIWDSIIDIDLKGAIFLMRRAAVCMQENNIQGNILQIASVAGNRGNNSSSPYHIAKNSLINTTRQMGKDAIAHGIVINGIAPGITRTKMSPGSVVRPQIQAIGRSIEADEIADIAMFMLSEQAKICVGETIIADGGFREAW